MLPPEMKIEFVTVGNSAIKRQVLEYLKHCEIIDTADLLYKINEAKMQDKGINFNARSRMDTQQLFTVATSNFISHKEKADHGCFPCVCLYLTALPKKWNNDVINANNRLPDNGTLH